MQAVKSKLAALHAKHQESSRAADAAEKELADIIAKAEALEALAEEKTTALNNVEDELDAAESQLAGHIQQLSSSEKAAEESLQQRKQLENRGINDNKRIEEINMELEEIQKENDQVEEKLELIQSQLQEAEELLDQEDERVEECDAKVKQLEVEVTLVGNSLRSMEICEKEGVERVINVDSKMLDLESKYKEKEVIASEYEARAEELEQQSDALDGELIQARQAYEATKVEFDALIAEINEI